MGFQIDTIKAGDCTNFPQPGQTVSVHYVGTLTDGSKFDSSRDRGRPFQFQLGAGQVIRGWDEGVAKMSKGQIAKLTLPHDYAYGERGHPPVIPPKATLIFELVADQKLYLQYTREIYELLRQERRRAYETTASTTQLTVELKATESENNNEENISKERLQVWAKRFRINIEEYQKGPIPGVSYFPNWITPDEEAAILQQVYAIPNDSNPWTRLKHRRLQMWGGEVKTTFNPQPLPVWLEQISQALVETGIFTYEKKPNHALINEYGVGDCILPHEDGPTYHPLVAIISTGAECRVTFELHRVFKSANGQHESETGVQRCEFQLERCSLLVFTGIAYTRYLHSMDRIEGGTRISLTIRHVN